MNLFHVMVSFGGVCVYGCLCMMRWQQSKILEEITRWMSWLLDQFIMLAIHLLFPCVNGGKESGGKSQK